VSEAPRPIVEDILSFWFGDTSGPTGVDPDRTRLWWKGHPDDDRAIRDRFGEWVERARAGALDEWQDDPRGALALVILLDQFTRCLGRGTAEAFAGDARALAVCRQTRERGLDRRLTPIERSFLYMPMMHAEDPAVADQSVQAFESLSREIAALGKEGHPDFRRHAAQHADIVRRFGRYPHRNELLGRPSTAEEREFLDAGGPTFGQQKR
jgi:uncharacterized protein (DUF924 family)